MRKTRQSLTEAQEAILAETEKFWAGVADRRKLSRLAVKITRASAPILETILRSYPEITLSQLLEAAEQYTARNLKPEQGNISGHHILASTRVMGEIAARIKTGQEAETLEEETAAKARLIALKIALVSNIRLRRSKNLSIHPDVLRTEAENKGLLKHIPASDVQNALETALRN